jgi:hypothetical protein
MILDESSSGSDSDGDDLLLFMDDASIDSETTIDTIDDIVIPTITSYTQFIYAPIVDTTIDFEGHNNTIDDFNDALSNSRDRLFRTILGRRHRVGVRYGSRNDLRISHDAQVQRT